MRCECYAFVGYWEDIGTVEAFYNANLALANPNTAQFRCGHALGRLSGTSGCLSLGVYLTAVIYAHKMFIAIKGAFVALIQVSHTRGY